jgi:O-antigen ligase
VAPWLVVAFAAWLGLSVGASSYRQIGIGWLISFVALVVLPALMGRSDPEVRRVVQGTWILLAAVLGVYALLETFVLHANPLYGPLYAAAPGTHRLTQIWGVYRATTSLGHPVENGVFFAVAVPLALGRAMARRSPAAVLAALLALGGVIASASRAALYAAIVGAVLVLASPAKRFVGARRAGIIRLAGLAVVVVTLTVGVLYVQSRAGSAEAIRSSTFRSSEVTIAVQAVESQPLLGSGPGAASFSHQSQLHGSGAGAFESFWLELAVGAGLPGLLLGVCVLLTALVSALRGGAADVAGALLAYLVAASAYNAFEGGRQEFLELGLLLAMALSASARRTLPEQDRSGLQARLDRVRPAPVPGAAFARTAADG